MTLNQAAKIVKENAEYIKWFEDKPEHKDLVDALFAQLSEAKKTLAENGIYAV